jgi:ferredoxin-NADP reductase
MLPVQVIRRDDIAPDVVSLFIVLPGTHQAPAPYLPGQFVTLALPAPDDTFYRSYSLCGGGRMDQPWELTIKRVNEGAVSTYFYDHVEAGTLLYASIPRGGFTLPADLSPDHVLSFVAVGSGITPIRGMLRALAALPPDERPLTQLFYASRSHDEVIYGDELAEIDLKGTWLRQLWYISSEGNRLSVEEMLARTGRMTQRAHWYICGPETLKRELQTALEELGVPAGQYHAELFAASTGPAYQVAAGANANAGGTLRIVQTGQELDVEPQETVLAALERHGYSPAFSCRAGACGACKLRVREGQVEPVGEVLSDSDRAAGYVLSCIAHPLGDVTLEAGGTPPKGVPIVAAVAGSGGGGTSSERATVRVAALASAALLLAGSWKMTDHRPYSWDVAAAVSSSSQSGQTGTSGSGGPSTQASPTGGTNSGGEPAPTMANGGGLPAPSATRSSGGGPAPTATKSSGGGGASPTATPVATAKPTPKPTPTCHSTPSKPC